MTETIRPGDVTTRKPEVLVHIRADGTVDYLAAGCVRLFGVDERAPRDRVYEMTLRCGAEDIWDIIGDSVIGHRGDARHAAVEARVREVLDGTPRLSLVPQGADEPTPPAA